LLAIRPNFRGVGASQGEFDKAVGETADMAALIEQFGQRYPQIAALPWVLAGFSFGTAVAAQLQATPSPDALILVGTAAQRFTFSDLSLPDNALLIHGETDEVVPLAEAMDFARGHGVPVTVIPDA